MSKKNTNVMTCGCAAVYEKDGQVYTSVDMLFAGIKNLIARKGHAQNQRRTATVRA
jgi:hypothetical protein